MSTTDPSINPLAFFRDGTIEDNHAATVERIRKQQEAQDLRDKQALEAHRQTLRNR